MIVALFGIAFSAMAQEVVSPTRSTTNDFTGRFEGAFEWEVIDDLSLEAGVELRCNNDFMAIDRVHTSLGASYKVNKYFEFGGGYTLINRYKFDDQQWDRPRHRVNVNLRGSVKLGRVELSLRERLQTTMRTDSVNRYEKMPAELILRSRLMAEYKIRHTGWTPYVMFELNNTLNSPRPVANYKRDELSYGLYITRYRLGLGAKLRITRNHRLDFFYYFDYNRDYNIDYKRNKGDLRSVVQENEYRHIFGVAYKFKL